MRWLYALVFYLATPLLVGYLAWRGWRDPAYRRGWLQRFGLSVPRVAPGGIWVHAASMGEVQAAAAVVKRLQMQWPEQPVLITTMTPTGAAHVERLFGAQVHHAYLPFDLPHAVTRFVAAVRPRLAVIVEMELWPNLFHAVQRRRDCPMVLINARLSATSARGYHRVRGLMAPVLGVPEGIAAQTDDDAGRLIGLGAPAARVTVTGSLKFDVEPQASAREQGEALRAQLGVNRPVWIAASTREGEEEPVLEAFAHVHAALPETLLLLVPRHPDRFDRVAGLCQERGWEVVRRSSGAPCADSTAIYLGDTMGELPVFYGAADLAFVGGSLVPVGAHNVLEPAALGLPVLVGPYVFNFEQIVADLVAGGAARQVSDAAALGEQVRGLLQRPDERVAMGRNGRALIEANRGATDEVMALVHQVLADH